MAQTLQQRFQKFYPDFMKVLPMDDVMFLATLMSADLLPGESRSYVSAQKTRAEKADEFLRRVIQPGFAIDVDTNELLDKLLLKMKESDYEPAKKLVEEFKGNCNKWLYAVNV